MGFLVKTKMKAYTKLNVVMCCQIVARMSVTPSSSDFRRRPPPRYACGQDQEFLRKKVLVKYFYIASAAAVGPPRVCNLNEFLKATCFFLLGGLGRGSPIENLTLICLVLKNLFF